MGSHALQHTRSSTHALRHTQQRANAKVYHTTGFRLENYADHGLRFEQGEGETNARVHARTQT
jgi:hypothetical protein